MTARPIIFSAPMVQALLAGRKTQTRRIIKPQPAFSSPFWKWMGAPMPGRSLATRCPYGVAGNLLWVRESFAYYVGQVEYRATPLAGGDPDRGWKPSIHMPRKFSRLTLRLTDVRVERLQAISEQDAEAEGAQVPSIIYADTPREAYVYAENYRLIWEHINGAGSWDVNPWVWALTFEVLRQNVDAVLQEKTA